MRLDPAWRRGSKVILQPIQNPRPAGCQRVAAPHFQRPRRDHDPAVQVEVQTSPTEVQPQAPDDLRRDIARRDEGRLVEERTVRIGRSVRIENRRDPAVGEQDLGRG